LLKQKKLISNFHTSILDAIIFSWLKKEKSTFSEVYLLIIMEPTCSEIL
jgi:hypothetical protein